MKISYAIPVCNEHAELEKLLDFLLLNIGEEDEIVVQCDDGNTTPEVYKVLEQFVPSYIEFPLNGHFSNFKNNLKKQCTGDWIFQIDADELPTYYLIKNLKEIIKCNPTVEMFMVPRINTVKGLTKEHIEKWGWRVDNNGWVNFPDFQTRIIQNLPKIKWKNKVHEQIVGISKQSSLPTEEPFCLYHHKNIGKTRITK